MILFALTSSFISEGPRYIKRLQLYVVEYHDSVLSRYEQSVENYKCLNSVTTSAVARIIVYKPDVSLTLHLNAEVTNIVRGYCF